jgi:ABC-type amino acid transport substrate-binding protein
VDILIPVAINFPNMGKLIALLFVLFGAWFVGSPIAVATYPKFVATGWVTFFGGIDLALPYMLSLSGLPADLFTIYSVSGVINGRFATLLACMELISITLICGAWLGRAGGLAVSVGRLIFRAAGVAVVGFIMLLSMRLMLEQIVPSAEDHSARLAEMDFLNRPEITVKIPGDKPPESREGFFRFMNNRGKDSSLQVGYLPENLPFSYFNGKGELVGYDVELVCRLAHDLDLKLEFYPVTSGEMDLLLGEKRLDLVISGVTLSESLIRKLGFSMPYQELVLGAVVSQDMKTQLDESDEQDIRQSNLKIAMVKPNPYLEAFRTALPRAEFIELSHFGEFYKAEPGMYDILLTSMEAGSAWNMLYPGFTTILLKGGVLKKEMVWACNAENVELIRYVNDWMRLQQSKGTMSDHYDYWFRGELRATEEKKPRWCIMRDMLGWGAEGH